VTACDTEIQQQFSAMKPRWEMAAETPVVVPESRRRRRKNEPPAENRAEVVRLTGVDVAAVGGIGVSLAQTILSEIGTDMTQWATYKHFASWLGLAPHNDTSAGKVLRNRTLPTNNRAGQAFRQAATAVSRGRSALGAYYRRKRAQGGPQFAQVATAHKIARVVYHMLKYHVQYADIGVAGFEQQQRERDIVALRKKAAKLGFAIVDRDASADAA
jgi:transposase